jgi:putative glutamine amidotransferase
MQQRDRKPRIGVPWRATSEEKAGKRRSYDHYLRAVSEAGGEPVEVSLLLPDSELNRLAASFDAVLLPGSGADVDPGRYGSRRGKLTRHAPSGRRREAQHAVGIRGGCLHALAGRTAARVNSSHHQAIRDPGRGLQVTAYAADGVIEAVEWADGPIWVVGVQWHPERMRGDALADALFSALVGEARKAATGR